MIFYFYAIADGLTADAVADLRGVQTEALDFIAVEGIVAVGGWVEGAPPLDRAVLEAQYALVQQLHTRARALLPMRFGVSVKDRAEAMALLEPRHERFARLLAAIAGREQMTVRVLGNRRRPTAAPTTSGDGPGHQYMAARAAQAAPAELRPLLDAARPIERATRIEASRHAGVIATVYQLIDRGRAGDYTRVVEEAARPLRDVRVLITGPSAAFAFAIEE